MSHVHPFVDGVMAIRLRIFLCSKGLRPFLQPEVRCRWYFPWREILEGMTTQPFFSVGSSQL